MLRRCAGEPDNIDLEDVWRIREEEIYPSLFGSLVRGIFPLQVRMFTRHFANQMWILGGFHYGVLEFAPSVTRHSWRYSASGYSKPWDQSPEEFNPDGESSAGVEFTLATTQVGD
jgi:hypothetical protein